MIDWLRTESDKTLPNWTWCLVTFILVSQAFHGFTWLVSLFAT